MPNHSFIDHNQSECKRCGTCCMKGGPGLHLEDRPLVESGRIPLHTLFTIREGEPAFDNIVGQISPARTDIIKVKGLSKNTGYCRFYDADKKACGIYTHRPAECRALKCWDTHDIETIYNHQRLMRRHLVGQVPGLWDLVEDHHQRCDYFRIARWADRLRQIPEDPAAIKFLSETIGYDHHLRQVTVERSQINPDLLVFLFGRPLSETIQMFKLKLTKHGNKYLIKP